MVVWFWVRRCQGHVIGLLTFLVCVCRKYFGGIGFRIDLCVELVVGGVCIVRIFV